MECRDSKDVRQIRIACFERGRTIFLALKSRLLHALIDKETTIGIDVGSSSIKVAVYANRKGALCLLKTDVREVGSISSENFGDDSRWGTILKDMLSGIDLEKSRVLVCINDAKTAIRKGIMPAMARDELTQAIRLEAKTYFPFSVDTCWVDFEVAEEMMEKGVRKHVVWVGASPQSTVTRWLSVLNNAGINPSLFAPAPIALKSFVANVHACAPGKTQAYLDIGKCFSELIIFKDKTFLFSRKIPVCGDDFTKALTSALISERGKIELTWMEAEEIKREVGIPTEDDQSIYKEKIAGMQILSMLRSPLEQVASEIDRCFDYFREEAVSEKIDALILFGGGSQLKGLPAFLSEELGMEVIPLGDIVDRTVVPMSRAACAMGVAQCALNGINLLPPQIKEKARRTLMLFSAMVAGALMILICAFLLAGTKIQIRRLQKGIADANEEFSSLNQRLEQTTKENVVNGILADVPYWEDVFKELGNLVPNSITLKELTAENKTIKIKGVIKGEEREKALTDFILALEKGLFKNVRLIVTKENPEKGVNEFELACWVDFNEN